MREAEASKIAAGFDGTLNLLVSTTYLFEMILLLAVPCHLYFASLLNNLHFWLTVSMGASVVLAAAATFIPLRLGARNLRQMEF